MATETDMAEWTCEETAQWAHKYFNEEVAKYFEEEEVDGETLMMLTTCASVEQLRACGLRTVKQQLYLRKLVSGMSPPTSTVTAMSPPTSTMTATVTGNKLTMSAMRAMSEEDRRLYLIKRNKVTLAAKRAWPGNDIPTFKNNTTMLRKLDDMVEELIPECSTPFFGKNAIRKHILDALNERRRQIKRGHDYEKSPGKKAKKEVKKVEAKAKKTENKEAMKVKPKKVEKTKEMLFQFSEVEDVNGGNDTANSSQPTASQEFNSPRVDSIASEEDPSEEDPSEESNQETELTQQSAGVVILCAFEVHHLKEVSRGQLQSATRFFTKNSEYKKTINKAEKAELLLPLARSFLREGIINIRDGADVSKLTRNDVMKEKTF